MDVVRSKKIDEVLKVGKWLGDYGTNNWALTKSQALEALDKLLALNIAVLGGDVLEDTGENIRPNYDNWFSDRHKGESSDKYVIRSIEETRNYIEQYKTYIPDKNYFVLVCKEIDESKIPTD